MNLCLIVFGKWSKTGKFVIFLMFGPKNTHFLSPELTFCKMSVQGFK